MTESDFTQSTSRTPPLSPRIIRSEAPGDQITELCGHIKEVFASEAKQPSFLDLNNF